VNGRAKRNAAAMSYDDLTEKLAKLAALYPKTFFVREQGRRPLKLGIHHDLNSDTTHGLSSNEVRQVIGWYCSSPAYRAAVVEGAIRVGLDGEAAGEVTAAAAAVAKAAMRREVKAERKAVAAVVVPETSTQAEPTNAKPLKNSNAVRLSLAGLRAAAKARQARV
jgi:ProP effector